MIMGASRFKRLLINGLIKFASLFSNAKVLQRLRFVKINDVVAIMGQDAVPEAYGGAAGREAAADFIAGRLKAFHPVIAAAGKEAAAAAAPPVGAFAKAAGVGGAGGNGGAAQ